MDFSVNRSCSVQKAIYKDLTSTFRASWYSARLSWTLVLTWVSPFVQDKTKSFFFCWQLCTSSTNQEHPTVSRPKQGLSVTRPRGFDKSCPSTKYILFNSLLIINANRRDVTRLCLNRPAESDHAYIHPRPILSAKRVISRVCRTPSLPTHTMTGQFRPHIYQARLHLLSLCLSLSLLIVFVSCKFYSQNGGK